MKKNTIFKGLGIIALIAVLALVCRVTVIPDAVQETTVNDAGETVVVEQLSVAQQYCLDNWDAKIVPTVKERAVDVATLIADTTADLNAAGEKYGNRANETSAWSFCVSVNAKALELENADKPNKTLVLLDLEPYDGQPDCKLFYGKVFSSGIKNAIRDGVGFLHLDDFANQVEFADLTTAFNDKVKSDILTKNTAESLVGKQLQFFGCISLTQAAYEDFVIIPVEMNVMEG